MRLSFIENIKLLNLIPMQPGKYLLLTLCLTIFIGNTFGQGNKPSVQEQYNAILDETETFKHYKVIPKNQLDGFVAGILDSLKNNSAKINNLDMTIAAQGVQIDSLNKQLKAINNKLAESNAINEQMVFLGATVNKTGYNIAVWSIIFLLVGAIIFVFYLYQKSHVITRGALKELDDLNNSFEQHKAKSQQKQVKLKRELQTALNILHEKGIKA